LCDRHKRFGRGKLGGPPRKPERSATEGIREVEKEKIKKKNGHGVPCPYG
jgi:hypothetical protein